MASDTQKRAIAEKGKGNACYKKKEFDKALEHYVAALKLDPTNISVMTNRAAVFFEQDKLDECIEECKKAIEVGRENKADYALIAKALCRIGNAYLKKDDLENALTFYNKSLAEHRTPDAVMKAQKVEALIKERKLLAYIDPEVSLEERTKGNEKFQEGKFSDAINHYSEAIKRNPDDAKIYSNRSACYMKLLEYPLALKDAEECIEKDPTFVKGYLRKGAALLAQEENNKACEAYSIAKELDPECKEAKDGHRKAKLGPGSDIHSLKERVLKDPEAQKILADPAMQIMLRQMQDNPDAIKDHLSNPVIREKIGKLVDCGIIDIR